MAQGTRRVRVKRARSEPKKVPITMMVALRTIGRAKAEAKRRRNWAPLTWGDVLRKAMENGLSLLENESSCVCVIVRENNSLVRFAHQSCQRFHTVPATGFVSKPFPHFEVTYGTWTGQPDTNGRAGPGPVLSKETQKRIWVEGEQVGWCL